MTNDSVNFAFGVGDNSVDHGAIMGNDFLISLEDRVVAIYSTYPRKMGKAMGVKRAMQQCKTEKKLKELETAVRNYRAYHDRKKTEPQYIKYFGSFMAPHFWKDWIDPNHGSDDHSVLDLSGVGFE